MASEPNFRFLNECLPLVSSYLFGQGVALSQIAFTEREESRDDFLDFIGYLKLRHTIALGERLRSAILNVERNPSSTSTLVRTQSKGVISGRLDIPRFVRDRTRSFSYPKSYPIVVSSQSLQTPENSLAKAAIAAVQSDLRQFRHLARSAERRAVDDLRQWASWRTAAAPWYEIEDGLLSEQLLRQVQNRVHKRQTGNEVAYSSLIDWVQDFSLSVDGLGGGSEEALAQRLLSFPTESFFWDRVFEIWVLQAILGALLRLGASIEEGPCPLHLRASEPTYSLDLGGRSVKLWFQRSLSAEKAAWLYSGSGNSLRGIPDVVVTSPNSSPLLVDAKNRFSSSLKNKSEEIYKMLGYLENFRSMYPGVYRSILVFVAEATHQESVVSEAGSQIDLITANVSGPSDLFEDAMDAAISGWVASLD